MHVMYLVQIKRHPFVQFRPVKVGFQQFLAYRLFSFWWVNCRINQNVFVIAVNRRPMGIDPESGIGTAIEGIVRVNRVIIIIIQYSNTCLSKTFGCMHGLFCILLFLIMLSLCTCVKVWYSVWLLFFKPTVFWVNVCQSIDTSHLLCCSATWKRKMLEEHDWFENRKFAKPIHTQSHTGTHTVV